MPWALLLFVPLCNLRALHEHVSQAELEQANEMVDSTFKGAVDECYKNSFLLK